MTYHLLSVVLVSLQRLVRRELAQVLVWSYRVMDPFPFGQGLIECGEVEAQVREFVAFLSMGSQFHVAIELEGARRQFKQTEVLLTTSRLEQILKL